MINVLIISSIFLLTKHVLLKKIVIIVDKLTRSRVLGSGAGICRAPKGVDGTKKNFYHAEQDGMEMG